ncbi:hydrolase [Lactobacillus sp. S2-2]|uniref:C40 family peptidase n=1 Tax=Lactobacillus sp. S2-2 TaxID=2692917 RepID=UPI001F264E95|nr:C40 family peptidase [Lactobacillus sp. S2-2]MCF6514577.1 hydrolase [Lactobacillus sp. S2-2]
MNKIIKFSLLIIASLMIGIIGIQNSNTEASSVHKYNDVYKVAKKQLGKPYIWGSVGPKGFDCSGLTSYAYKKGIKVNIPRTAQAQYSNVKKISRKNLKKGDLVHFGYSKRSISHVGLYIGKGKMIDAQNRGVIVERINSPWWHTVGYSRPAKLDTNQN